MPIKVLYLHHVAQIGGAENSLLLLLRNLQRDRVDPIFAGPAAGPFPKALTREGIPIWPIAFGRLRNVRSLILSVYRVLQLIRDHHIDLLHSNGPQTNICAGLAGRLTRVPAVWHTRNLLHGHMRDVDRLFARLATRVICNSDAVRERFRGSSAWPKSLTIRNAVDTHEFHPAVSREPFRREVGLSTTEVAVGIVGRIDPAKGHADFVEAAIQLLAETLPARFFIVGEAFSQRDVWHAEKLRSRIQGAGLEERIQFTGFRADIPSVMRALDVLVLASEVEACSRVLLEAMASGTSVVATDCGGTPEIVQDGREGILVPPHDPHALAASIRLLINDPCLRQRFARAGLLKIPKEFTMERYTSQTLEVYADALRRE